MMIKSRLPIWIVRWYRLVQRVGLALLVLAVVSIALAETLVQVAASGRIHEDLECVPRAHVALVLGTGRTTKSGRPNVFYRARVEAAARLYHAHRVRGIVVSGDNSRPSYDEPTDMLEDLVALGVPARFITRDYAGFRTLDSIVRAREVFGLDRVIIVSQAYHAERALFLADRCGLEATAYAAEDASSPRLRRKNRARDGLARVAAVLDVAIGRRPKYLGPKEGVALAER
ncbi:MAG: YdcF family protein [Planctomycetes bacterium]|nr:YdcF family protein [Planctomycetota bacterium]